MKANVENIYEHIGYLFYALYAEQANLTAEPFQKLNYLIDCHWESLTHGDKKLDAYLMGCIHSGLRKALDNHMSASDAYGFFEDYFTIHHLSFGTLLNERILKFAKIIAELFFRNMRHSVFTDHLEKLLEVKPVHA
jgi:hypothetical protein